MTVCTRNLCPTLQGTDAVVVEDADAGERKVLRSPLLWLIVRRIRHFTVELGDGEHAIQKLSDWSG